MSLYCIVNFYFNSKMGTMTRGRVQYHRVHIYSANNTVNMAGSFSQALKTMTWVNRAGKYQALESVYGLATDMVLSNSDHR